MTTEEYQAKIQQTREQLDKARQEYFAALTEQRTAEHRRDLAYLKLRPSFVRSRSCS